MIRIRSLSVTAAMLVALASAAEAQQINHPTTFTGQTDLTLTNNATVTGTGTLQLTPAANNNLGGVFSTAKVPINQFVTQFDFHILGTVGGMADGMGFCIQNVANNTIGGGGGGMGFAGMATPSMFIKFDCYNNVSTTQIYTNGTAPADAGSIDLRAVGIDWHTQHNFRCTMTYNGTTISMTLQDLTTMASNTQTFPIDLVTLMGAGTAYVGFTAATGGANANHELLNWTYSSLPAPTGLTATPGPNTVTLNWNAVAGATGYNIYRIPPGTAPNYTLIGTVGAVTTYTDTTVTYPTSYTYVVQTIQGAVTSLYSTPVTVTPNQPQVTATPNTGLQTSENLTSTNFTIVYNVPAPGAGSVLTVVSNNINEGTVAAQGLATTPVFNGGGQQIGFTYTVAAGQSPTIDCVVTGVDDALVDGPIAYTVSVTATNMGVTIPSIALTNQDNDTQGLTFTRTSGIITTESGGQAQFSVFLNRQPFGNVSFSLTSSNVLEGTVLPGTLTFTATGGQPYSAATGFGGWNVAHDVTVTGVDDTLLDFTIPYTIVTGALQFADTRDQTAFTNAGVTAVPDVACVNFDNEVPPELPVVWGNGGCGLLGLEAVLLLLLWRRSRA